jgi:hypothetical protein
MANVLNQTRPKFFLLIILASVTCITGILVAFAPWMPWRLVTTLVSLSVIVYLLLMFFSAAFQVYLVSKNNGLRSLSLYLLIFALSVTTMRSLTLGLTQILSGNPFQTFNVDYRYHLMHTKSILSASGTTNSLVAWGQPIDYHVGPAWLAASLFDFLKIPIELSSFVIIPIFTIFGLAIFLLSLFKFLNLENNTNYWSVSLLLAMPFVSTFLPDIDSRIFAWHWFSAESIDAWFLGPSLMLNSFFAIWVLSGSIIILLATDDKRLYSLAGLGVASLYEIKPQFIASASIIIVSLVLIDFINHKIDKKIFTKWLYFMCTAIALVFSFAIKNDSAFLERGTLEFHFQIPKLNKEELASFVTSPAMLVSLFFLLYIVFFVIAQRGLNQLGVTKHLALFLLSVNILIVLIKFLLWIFVVSLTASNESYNINSDLLQGINFLQWAIFPINLLVITKKIKINARILMTPIIGFSLLLSVQQTIYGIIDPTTSYEYVDASNVAQLLSVIPNDSSLFITSDIAEPADDYKRSGDANYLPAVSGHHFWIAGHRYPDLKFNSVVKKRLGEVNYFFSVPWTNWHKKYLLSNRITHILVSERCYPTWLDASPIAFTSTTQENNWFIYDSLSLIEHYKFLSKTTQNSQNNELMTVNLFRNKFGAANCLHT